jgi:hypothetical protein
LKLLFDANLSPKLVGQENCNYRTLQAAALLRRHAIAIADLEHSGRDFLIIKRNA